MTRTSLRALTLLTCLLLATSVIQGGQSPADAQATEHTPKFRVGVDIVRIDAVVTDRDGRTVPNLTAADFQVRQDGKLQTVTYAQFMPVSSAPAAEAAAASVAGTTTAPASAALNAIPGVRPEEIQRTLAIVVDDLGMSFGSFHGMQRALHTFVDKEIRPGDLVAIVRTSGAGGGLQPFTTDRRVLDSVIDGLRWTVHSRNGVEPFAALNKWKTFSGGGPEDASAPLLDPDDFTRVDQARRFASAAGSLGALNLVVRGARDLPGRKAIILVSEGLQLLDPTDAGLPDPRTRGALDRVTEQATRAGVVIYALDPRGLQTGGLLASDNLKSSRRVNRWAPSSAPKPPNAWPSIAIRRRGWPIWRSRPAALPC